MPVLHGMLRRQWMRPALRCFSHGQNCRLGISSKQWYKSNKINAKMWYWRPLKGLAGAVSVSSKGSSKYLRYVWNNLYNVWYNVQRRSKLPFREFWLEVGSAWKLLYMQSISSDKTKCSPLNVTSRVTPTLADFYCGRSSSAPPEES